MKIYVHKQLIQFCIFLFIACAIQSRLVNPDGTINENTKNSNRVSNDPKDLDDPNNPFVFPERFVQNVHGYFYLNKLFPTKLKLSYSWDPEKGKSVKDGKVYFYAIDVVTGQPKLPVPTPTSKIPAGYEI